MFCTKSCVTSNSKHNKAICMVASTIFVDIQAICFPQLTQESLPLLLNCLCPPHPPPSHWIHPKSLISAPDLPPFPSGVKPTWWMALHFANGSRFHSLNHGLSHGEQISPVMDHEICKLAPTPPFHLSVPLRHAHVIQHLSIFAQEGQLGVFSSDKWLRFRWKIISLLSLNSHPSCLTQ